MMLVLLFILLLLCVIIICFNCVNFRNVCSYGGNIHTNAFKDENAFSKN